MRGMPRILSRPFGIEWCGWHSNTLRLQNSGWQLAVEADLFHHMYRLAMHHRALSLFALTDARHVDNLEKIVNPGYMGDMPVFRVNHVAPKIVCERVMMDVDFSAFKEIDAMPCVTTREIQSIEDMNIFNVPRTRTEEILVNKSDMSVIEHLEAIKKLQQPQQDEIRVRMRDRESQQGMALKPKMEMIAQLVHYAEAA